MAMIIIGETIRKTGMLTAQRNFTHDVQIYKREGHVLVTSGIYRYCSRVVVASSSRSHVRTARAPLMHR